MVVEVSVDGPQFDEWLGSAGPRLHRAAFLLTTDWALAEDLVQVTCAIVWEKRRRVESLDAYARRVMVRTFTSWRRRRWTGEIPAEQLRETAVDSWREVDQRVSLKASLAELNPRQRAVLFLRFYEDMTEADTADILGWPLGTVKSTTARALADLRKLKQFEELR
jgi:RNA polymerase sigma-70 factor (sigma-E family)